jgi:gelsolin
MTNYEGTTVATYRSSKLAALHTEDFEHVPFIEILLLRGENLPAVDDDGKSDPFVLFSVFDERVRSSTAKQNLNPRYGETFQIALPSESVTEIPLVCEVWDWSPKQADKLMGKVSVKFNLENTQVGVPIEQNFQLPNGGTIQTRIIIQHTSTGINPVTLFKPVKHYHVETPVAGGKVLLHESNVAGIGSKQDIALRVAAAQTASEWKGVGQKPGLQIWRIEQFTVKPWPEKDYGKFFDGDSYIILNTYRCPESEKLLYDVHYWLGCNTSLDESGTAAYKTVELDDLLGDIPVQHREVQGSESQLFLSYFPKGIHIISGGIESGFNHVCPEKYSPKLFCTKGKITQEVKLNAESLNRMDVFILDDGLNIYVWQGKYSSGRERHEGNAFANALRSERMGHPHVFVGHDGDSDEEEEFRPFWELLKCNNSKIPQVTQEEIRRNNETNQKVVTHISLYRLSDNSGSFEIKKVEEGEKLDLKLLDSNDVFIADTTEGIFVWVGNHTSVGERKYAMQYAEYFALQHGKSQGCVISRVMEGSETALFLSHFSSPVTCKKQEANILHKPKEVPNSTTKKFKYEVDMPKMIKRNY